MIKQYLPFWLSSSAVLWNFSQREFFWPMLSYRYRFYSAVKIEQTVIETEWVELK